MANGGGNQGGAYLPDNHNFLAQNPLLMNAGMQLVQNVMGNGFGSPSMQQSQSPYNGGYPQTTQMQQSQSPYNGGYNGGYQQTTQNQPTQPAWMSQGTVTLESFPMAQSMKMSSPGGQFNPNQGYQSNHYPKY